MGLLNSLVNSFKESAVESFISKVKEFMYNGELLRRIEDAIRNDEKDKLDLWGISQAEYKAIIFAFGTKYGGSAVIFFSQKLNIRLDDMKRTCQGIIRERINKFQDAAFSFLDAIDNYEKTGYCNFS